MPIRDRIKELRRVPAATLRANPRNWRTHPRGQQAALRGVLQQIGYAGALIAREMPDGGLELIDGHLRAATTPGELVPVLVLDVNEAEAATLLATLDPLAAMAQTDAGKLEALLKEVGSVDAALDALLADLAGQAEAVANASPAEPPGVDDDKQEPDAVAVPCIRQVLAECRDEAEQREIYDWLQGKGVRCRVLTLS